MSKILVIDDESWLREMIRLALEQQGFEVVEAMDSAEGVAQAREQLPDQHHLHRQWLPQLQQPRERRHQPG